MPVMLSFKLGRPLGNRAILVNYLFAMELIYRHETDVAPDEQVEVGSGRE